MVTYPFYCIFRNNASQENFRESLKKNCQATVLFLRNHIKIKTIYPTTAIILLLCVIHKDVKSCLKMKFKPFTEWMVQASYTAHLVRTLEGLQKKAFQISCSVQNSARGQKINFFVSNHILQSQFLAVNLQSRIIQNIQVLCLQRAISLSSRRTTTTFQTYFPLAPQSSLCALARNKRRKTSGKEKLTFLFCAIGAINNDTYEKMNTNEIYKYMKTLARIHPRHRSRYSHTAYLHSTIPDPVQNRMIDR